MDRRLIISSVGAQTIDRIATIVIWCSGIFALILPLGILGYLAIKGVTVLSWEFLFSPPSGFPLGTAGGIWPAIKGTIVLIVLAMLVAVPTAILSGIYLSEFAKSKNLVRTLELSVECFAAIPAVIYGLFGYAILVVLFSFKISLLSGSLTLALMMFPIILIGTRSAILSVPSIERESAESLGVGKSYIIRKVILPRSWPGIASSIVLAAGHAAGSAAPVMYTASTVFSPVGITLNSPVMTLPTHLYNLVAEGTSFDHAFGTAFVLVTGMLLANILSLLLRHRCEK